MSALKKVLVVDDSKFIRSMVRKELGEAYEIKEAGTGLEALKAIQGGFIPDLITLDIEMPELDGFGACERLYSEEFQRYFPTVPGGRVPVLFLTARDTLADRRKGFELGAINFISKQFEPGALADAVSKILHPRDPLRGIQVLVVDDSDTIRLVVARALRDSGVDIIQASDGLEAFTLLCNRMSSIDLVISDIEMPQMDGIELCRRIRRELGLVDLPVVFLSGTDQEQRLSVFEAGATDCLTKPFIKEEMIARLQVHIEKALLNRRLRRAVADLRGSLQRQRDMLATLSHDMRSPLSGIMGFAELLGMEDNRTPFDIESIDLIKQSSHMLLRLVDDILALSKQQAGQLELELQPTDLRLLIERSVAMFQGIAKRKQQTVILDPGPSSIFVSGHAESLMRVCNNLLSNALKFTPEGGRVHVGLDMTPEGMAVITVADTGIGIASEKLKHIFDRYSQTSRSGTSGESSTGLGMSIVREFVEAHKGTIEVSSELGKGTRFRITLPLIPTQPSAATEGGTAEIGGEQHARLRGLVQGCRVLVADDNPVNRNLASSVLHAAGCIVREAVDGKSAVGTLIASPTAYDLVLMDVYMPEMDGITATRAVRAGGCTLPIIALTGNAGESDRASCMAAGMNGFLIKPFAPRALLEVVARHRPGAAGSRPPPPAG